MEYSTKAFVIHDGNGQIISVGRPAARLRGKVDVKPVMAGHLVTEIELDANQSAMSVAELHKSHRVDTRSGKLVRN
jgi:hypothetical protein